MANDREIQLLIKAKDEAQGVLSGHLKQLDDLTQKHLGLSLKAVAAYAAVATAIVGATAELYKFADRMAEMGDAMDEMSQRTNMSVEELSKWSYVLEKDGASIQEFEGATRKLSRAMYDASTGGKETAAAFAALGVDIIGADGKLISVDEAMMRVSDGLKGTTNETERTALMMQLLGRGSGDLAIVMGKGSEAIRAQMGELERLGGVMSGDFAKASAGFEDAQDRLAAAWSGLKMAMAEPLMEPFANATDRAARAIADMNDKLERQVQLRVALGAMFGSYAPMVQGMGTYRASMGALPGDAAMNYGSFATPWTATASAGSSASAPAAAVEVFNNSLADSQGMFDSLNSDIRKAFDGNVLDTFNDNLNNVGETGSNSAQMIGSAMASALEQAIFEAKDLDDILGGLARGFFSMGLTSLLTPGAGFLGLAQGGGIPGAAQGMSVRGGIPGMDSVLIRAQSGEEVLDRTLAADLRSYLASVRFSPGSASLKGAASTGGNYAVAINTMYPTRPSDSRRLGRDIVRSIKEAERSTL